MVHMQDTGPNMKMAEIFNGLKWVVECSVLDCRQLAEKNNSLDCHGDFKKKSNNYQEINLTPFNYLVLLFFYPLTVSPPDHISRNGQPPYQHISIHFPSAPS